MAPHSSTSLILLCSTSYDEVTCFMSQLLADFSYAGKIVHHAYLTRSDVSYLDVLAKYGKRQDNVVLIFCGNGDEDALLTATSQDCNALTEISDEKVFYDSAYFGSGPNALAAFCDNAGKYLGRAFAKDNGGGFLGFSDDLWLLPGGSDECNYWWRKILNGLIIRVIDDERVDEDTVSFVRSLYEEAYNYFCSEKGGAANEALGMRMCLRQNLSVLCNY